MAYVNNAMIIKRDLITRLAKLMKEERLVEGIDRMPVDISPREKGPQRRCCVYKERAVIKYKLLPLMGFDVKDEEDELTPLSEYAHQALDRQERKKPILTVVDEACTACVKVNYVVTNLCKGCVASPCKMNCPKNAISFNKEGKAEIDHNLCVNCGLCKNVCPYHSIIYVPVPCEEACPVGAISKDEKGVEHIDDDKCIYCGRCINACPFGSIYEISEIIDVLQAIRNGKKVVAMVAPSIMGQYKADSGRVFAAIKALGFSDVVEVAKGAIITTKTEAKELEEHLEAGHKFMTTSCCPSYVEVVEKHVPAMKPFMSTTGSPMYYTTRLVKEEDPEALTVFIGPCVAKRSEARKDKMMDMVMSYEELDCILKGFEIEIEKQESEDLDDIKLTGRGFGQSGGVAKAVLGEDLRVDVKAYHVNGLDRKNINLLKAFAKGKVPGNFVEVMACEGGCIAGPSAMINSQTGKKIYNQELDAIY